MNPDPGVDAVRSALETPLRSLVEQNYGDIDGVCQQLIVNPDFAYDATCRQVVNADNGPLDPATVVAGVILQAAEAAARIVRTRTWDLSLEFDVADRAFDESE